MIKHWLITGDKHQQFQPIRDLDTIKYPPEETAIIILGDAGVNWNLDHTDQEVKYYLSSLGYRFYLVRGNHEERPENISNIHIWYDKEIDNNVYIEDEFPSIRYLIDGTEYNFNDYHTLVLGGAYSVDKEYRIQNNWNWFQQEQLSAEERISIFHKTQNYSYDIVLSHTCPYTWRPTELFLPSIDQSTVDTSTEEWLEYCSYNMWWDSWYWGHYHKDQDYSCGRHMVYNRFIEIE